MVEEDRTDRSICSHPTPHAAHAHALDVLVQLSVGSATVLQADEHGNREHVIGHRRAFPVSLFVGFRH
jgi:hypothetical protein